MLEALSDASAEQFLNPLVASDLRKFGRDLASRCAPERVFWVRSEWDKVDLSYGLAEPFELTHAGWQTARKSGTAGELGKCEVKVCYAHFYAGKIKCLEKQLRQRERASMQQSSAYGTPAQGLRYYGLVWLFEHGGAKNLKRVGKLLEEEASGLGLAVRHGFCDPAVRDLGRIWPSSDGSTYQCSISAALFELANEFPGQAQRP